MSPKNKIKNSKVTNLNFPNGQGIAEMEFSNNSLSVISVEPESQHE